MTQKDGTVYGIGSGLAYSYLSELGIVPHVATLLTILSVIIFLKSTKDGHAVISPTVDYWVYGFTLTLDLLGLAGLAVA